MKIECYFLGQIKIIIVFWVTGLKILGWVGTHIFIINNFIVEKYNCMH